MANSAEVEKLNPWSRQYKQMEKGIRKKLVEAEKNADDYVSAVSALVEVLAGNEDAMMIEAPSAVVDAAYQKFKATYKSLVPKEAQLRGRDVRTGRVWITAWLNGATARMQSKLDDTKLQPLENRRASLDKILMDWLGDSVRRYKWIAPIHFQLQKMENSANDRHAAINPIEDYNGSWIDSANEFWAMIDDKIDDPRAIEERTNIRFPSAGRLQLAAAASNSISAERRRRAVWRAL